ncbi:EXOCYST COMPLEX PROTEIN EXO70 [Salix viminalis]|uniref:Exocyst subunit Exo70 family protein n=1 Tax=Salix viminalis TaxID=40686 RepID=A0A9Q0SCX7_SALVM|nr:EXOCYST COMPLEX PROTEIN EXO70 [Salix viminalis]
MATTTTTSGLTREGGGGEDDRVMATAQKIVNSLNTSKNAREDMLLILSSFDNRLSNLSYVIKTGSESQSSVLDTAEKIILRSDSGMSSNAEAFSWYDSAGEAGDYLDAVDKILDLLDNLSVGPDPEVLDRAETVLQVAMSRLEEEFGHILIRNTVPLDAERLYGSIRRVSLSFAANEGEIDEEFASFEEVESGSVCFHERGGSLGDDLCVDLINSEAVMYLKDIADRMIRAGYEKECVQGVEKLSIEEVQRIDWKSLDEKMKKWVRAVKAGDRVLLRGERRLCDVIFSGSDSAREVCFNETAKGFLMQLLNFAEAVSIGRRSPEKLFRILDMYDALSGVFPDLEAMVTDEFVYSEAKGVLAGLGRAAKGTFVEFENAVKSETSRKPMLGGVIHPLTRYVMNYVKLLVDYSDTLNSLLENDEDELDGLQNDDSERLQLESSSPIARRLLALLSTLESNLEEKSTLYEDGAMRYIFRMNNILYMVQKVKDSELIKILGDQWVRNHRGQIRRYATAYLRAAWSKALSCLKDEGIGGSSNNASSKVALKERFKSFNACFEEIYRIQTGWKVPDPQLREELRISISENVLPAYRSFTGRFGSQIDSGRNAGKYIKYSPDDLENYLIDLFEGTPLVLHHLRRKNSS